MLCLSCSQESRTSPCSNCGADLGDFRANQGYLPQLRNLEHGLADGTIEAEEAEIQLELLEEALSTMLKQLEKTRDGMLISLDELQMTTFNAVLEPLRGALEKMLACVQGLPVEAPWSAWPALEAAQVKVAAGYRAIQLMVQIAMQKGMEAGVSRDALQRNFQQDRS